MYLALAEQESAGLATADRSLAEIAQERGIDTALIGGAA
jgi:predicted nucleic acid-binding protein